jgi:hypothetical protein
MKKELWIDGQLWKVQRRRRLPKNTLGLTNPFTKTITISSTITDADVFNEVLCHEITHAFLSRSVLYNTIEEKLTEDICDAIGIQLNRFIKDNFIKETK